MNRLGSDAALGGLRKPFEERDLFASGLGGAPFGRAIGVDHFASEGRQSCAATRFAAGCRIDQRLAERRAQVAYKAPGAGVAHAERTTLRDG